MLAPAKWVCSSPRLGALLCTENAGDFPHTAAASKGCRQLGEHMLGMGGLVREPLCEPRGTGESSGPFWDWASFFFPKCHWMDEAAGAKQPSLQHWGGTEQDSVGRADSCPFFGGVQVSHHPLLLHTSPPRRTCTSQTSPRSRGRRMGRPLAPGAQAMSQPPRKPPRSTPRGQSSSPT